VRLTKYQKRKMIWVLRNKTDFFGEPTYLRPRSNFRGVTITLAKYYGIKMFETNDELYRFYYRNVRRGIDMTRWYPKRMTCGKYVKLCDL